MRVTSEDILLNSPPFFHCFGLVLGNLAFWTHGACVVVAKCAFVCRRVAEVAASTLIPQPTCAR